MSYKLIIINNKTKSWTNINDFLNYLKVRDEEIYESKGYSYQDIEHEKYIGMFISKSCYSDLNYILKSNKLFVKGIYIIDNLLCVGNTSNRYISIHYNGKSFDKNSLKVVEVRKKNELRKISTKYFQKNPEKLDVGIVSLTQKRMLLKGIAI